MRTRLPALAAVLAALVVGVLLGSTGVAAAVPAADLARWANAERAAAGRPAYAVRADLAEVAVRHARRMAAAGTIWHNPRLGAEVSGWTAVGENVGVGGTARSVHDAFLRSPDHRANILDRDYTEVGVGAVTGADGRLYVAEVFRRPVAAAPAPTATAPRPARTAAAPARAAAAAPVRAVVARPKPGPSPAEVLAAHRPPRPGALTRAVAYHRLLAALAAAAE